MDNQQHHTTHPIAATVLSVMSMIGAIFSAITMHELQVVAIIIAIISGVFAMRYHYLASVEKKLIIEEKRAALRKQALEEKSSL